MEESGIIIIKAPSAQRKELKEGLNDPKNAVQRFAGFCEVELDGLELESLNLDSVTNKAGFIRLDYDCSNWTAFSDAILKSEQKVSYYARHHNEYGVSSYYCLTPAGKKLFVEHDEEADEENEEALESLGLWMSKLPAALKREFPDFLLEEHEFLKPGNLKKKQRQPQVNLTCFFVDPISAESLEQRLSEPFREFSVEQKRGDGLRGLLSSLFGKKAKKKTEPTPESLTLSWFPVSAKGAKTAEELLGQLMGLTTGEIYANKYFGNSSFPYRILRAQNGNIEELFTTEDFEKRDLDAFSDQKDEEFGGKINWMSPDLSVMRSIQERYGLLAYATERIAKMKAEAEAEYQKKLAIQEKVWAEYEDDIVPVLRGLKVTCCYRQQSHEETDQLATRLQRMGMWKEEVEPGLGFAGKNAILLRPELKEAGEFLVENLPELSGHRLSFQDHLEDDELWICMH